MDEVKKYARVLVPVSEFNKLRKCELDFHQLKKSLANQKQASQEGTGSNDDQCQNQTSQDGRGSNDDQSCHSAAEEPVATTSAAAAAALVLLPAPAASTTPAPFLSKELATVLRQLLSRHDQEGTGEVEAPADIITRPPFLNKDVDDLVTKAPLADHITPGAPAADLADDAAAAAQLTPKKVLAGMPVSSRKRAKVLVEAIFSLDKVSALAKGGITVDGKMYTDSEFSKLISFCFRKQMRSIRVRGLDHFFQYLTRVGLMTLVPNKKLVKKFGVIAPGADGTGKLSPPLTSAEKRILAGKWWLV